MKIIVKPHQIKIIRNEDVNEKEINISKCEFEFDERITNEFTKEAYFTLNGNTYKQIIVNDECDFPNEILEYTGNVEIGVVAFKIDSNNKETRFNPTSKTFPTKKGSLKANAENSEPITPSEMEQYEQALQGGLNELDDALDDLQEKVDSGYFKGDRGDKGDTGERGPAGPTGPQGIQGERGLTGETGPAGRDGTDGTDYVITQQDYNTIAGIVETNIQPTLTSIQNTANNANSTANTANTTANTASSVASSANSTANTAKSIAEGANQALSYNNYSSMISAFNSLSSTTYKVGQNIMIVTLNVPDLWISEIASSSSTYTYTTDEAFTTALSTNGYVQVGYYKLSALETQKVDLTNYVTKDEFVTLTQQQYDNLQTIDPDAYYYIIEE